MLDIYNRVYINCDVGECQYDERCPIMITWFSRRCLVSSLPPLPPPALSSPGGGRGSRQAVITLQSSSLMSSSGWTPPHLTHTARGGRTGTVENSAFGTWKEKVEDIPAELSHTAFTASMDTLLILQRSQYLRHMSVIHLNPRWQSEDTKMIDQSWGGPIMMS